jgi:hypothetical protein
VKNIWYCWFCNSEHRRVPESRSRVHFRLIAQPYWYLYFLFFIFLPAPSGFHKSSLVLYKKWPRHIADTDWFRVLSRTITTHGVKVSRHQLQQPKRARHALWGSYKPSCCSLAKRQKGWMTPLISSKWTSSFMEVLCVIQGVLFLQWKLSPQKVPASKSE